MSTKATYSEKLKNPKWQRKRLEIFQRDNFTCQLCKGTTRTLHVHHTEYNRGVEPWDYPNENLITYCDRCHFIVEDFRLACTNLKVVGCINSIQEKIVIVSAIKSDGLRTADLLFIIEFNELGEIENELLVGKSEVLKAIELFK